MIEYVLDKFFVVNRKSKLTILKNRETCFKDANIKRKIEFSDGEGTCLSSFFINVKGLNVKERLSANYLI